MLNILRFSGAIAIFLDVIWKRIPCSTFVPNHTSKARLVFSYENFKFQASSVVDLEGSRSIICLQRLMLLLDHVSTIICINT